MPFSPKAKAAPPVTVSYSDSIRLVRDQVHWSPKGVRLLCKWHFAEGTEIEFAFDHQGERHCCSGVVVACHPLRQPVGYFEMVLYFIEIPCSRLQKAACDCRLSSHDASDSAHDEIHFTTTNQARGGGPLPSSNPPAESPEFSRHRFRSSKNGPRFE